MKKIFILFLLFMVSAPVFSAPGYEEAMVRIGGKPRVYDVSESQAYFQELERKFHEKYKDGKNGGITGEKYDKEVWVPFLDFEAEQQRQCKPGFDYTKKEILDCQKRGYSMDFAIIGK